MSIHDDSTDGSRFALLEIDDGDPRVAPLPRVVGSAVAPKGPGVWTPPSYEVWCNALSSAAGRLNRRVAFGPETHDAWKAGRMADEYAATLPSADPPVPPAVVVPAPSSSPLAGLAGGPAIPARGRAARVPPTVVPVPAAIREERPSARNLIGVDDAVSSTGVMTYWHLPGTVDETKLAAAWAAEGLPEENRPRTPSATVALHRACKEQASKARLLRAHPEGGWTLVDERNAKTDEGKRTLAYEVGVRIRLSDALPGRPEQILITPPGGKNASEEVKEKAREVGAKVRADFNAIREQIASVDVSVWLVKFVGGLGGVALRESGGFYFVPKAHAETLAKVARALAASSTHTVYEIPVMQGSKTVRAVLDGLRIEVASAIKTVESELTDSMLGARAVRNRTDEVEALVAKVRGYAKLFGVSLDDVCDRLAALAVKLATKATRGALLEVD